MEVLGYLNALAGGEFFECFSDWFPSNGFVDLIVPFGVSAGGDVRSSDEVFLQGWGGFGNADVFWDALGDLVLSVEECCGGAWDPGGEEAGSMNGFAVYGLACRSARMLIWASKVSSSNGLTRS